ncbi:MAG: ROK family protein, partial [Phycisphaerae bacterium]
MGSQFAVGVDIGGSFIKAGLVDDAGALLSKSVRPTLPQRPADEIVADVATLISEVIEASPADRESIAGVGIGSPGPLSPTRGIIHRAANLPTFKNFPLRDRVAEGSGMPAVLVNDANAAGFAERWVGAGHGADNLVMFTLGTGIGSAVFVDGRVLSGGFENAGELGHMIIERNGRPCSCGQRGCLEQYASAANIVRRVSEAMRQGADSVLAKIAGAPEAITAKDVAQAVREGDSLAVEIWRDACAALATGCVNVLHAYNPRVIVLGGGLSGAGAVLLDAVRQSLQAQVWSLHDDLPEIVLAELGNDAGIIGAAGTMLQALANP